MLPSGAVFSAMGRAGEAGVGQWSVATLWEKRTHHRAIRASIPQPIPFQGTQLSSGKGFHVSPTCGLPAAASRKAGWGEHISRFRFVSWSSSTSSCFHSIFRLVFTGVCQSISGTAILSALHFFIVPITIWSWCCHVLVYGLSLAPLDLQLHKR